MMSAPKKMKTQEIYGLFWAFFLSSIINAFRCLLLGIFLKYRIYVGDQMQNLIDFLNIYYISLDEHDI